MSKALLIGGFSCSEANLTPVAREMLNQGFELDDKDIFTFREGMNKPDTVKKASQGRAVITLSAGLMPLAERPDARPAEVLAIAGPEPTTIGGLVLGAAKLTMNHQKAIITGPNRFDHFLTNVRKGLELGFHPYENLRHLRSIGAFSTQGALERMQTTGAEAQAVVMAGDEFGFIPDISDIVAPTRHLEGGHENILINPSEFFDRLYGKNE